VGLAGEGGELAGGQRQIADDGRVVGQGVGDCLQPGAERRVAPEEWPNKAADPPAAVISAARSSISRSTAYGAVSPLSPRPRRS
jgi:hypothetical protein